MKILGTTESSLYLRKYLSTPWTCPQFIAIPLGTKYLKLKEIYVLAHEFFSVFVLFLLPYIWKKYGSFFQGFEKPKKQNKTTKSFYFTFSSLPPSSPKCFMTWKILCKEPNPVFLLLKRCFFSSFFEAAENISLDSKDPNNCSRRRQQQQQQQLAAQIVKLGIGKK